MGLLKNLPNDFDEKKYADAVISQLTKSLEKLVEKPDTPNFSKGHAIQGHLCEAFFRGKQQAHALMKLALKDMTL